MWLFNEHSVTSQCLILLLMFQKYKKVIQYAHRNGKFGGLPTEHLSGGGCNTSLHPTVETSLLSYSLWIYFNSSFVTFWPRDNDRFLLIKTRISVLWKIIIVLAFIFPWTFYQFKDERESWPKPNGMTFFETQMWFDFIVTSVGWKDISTGYGSMSFYILRSIFLARAYT